MESAFLEGNRLLKGTMMGWGFNLHQVREGLSEEVPECGKEPALQKAGNCIQERGNSMCTGPKVRRTWFEETTGGLADDFCPHEEKGQWSPFWKWMGRRMTIIFSSGSKRAGGSFHKSQETNLQGWASKLWVLNLIQFMKALSLGWFLIPKMLGLSKKISKVPLDEKFS